MVELDISINNSSNHPERDLRAVLGNFEEQHGAKVLCTVFDWTQSWAEIMKIVLYKHGPVMSQVGTTWMGSLEATQGVRPFTPSETTFLGGADVFHPAAWQTCISLETGSVTGVPWFLDTYVLYYRKDILSKAGVDETKAFESYASLAGTLQKLIDAEVEIPLALPTVISSRANLHNLAGWVWSYGGEFISEDGRKLLLSDPKTMQGLKAYFSLYQYMPKPAQLLSDADCYAVFMNGRAAISLRNSNLLYETRNSSIFAEHIENLGVVAMPGINFVGGSNFVLWKHLRPLEERLALDLLRKLISPDVQIQYFKQSGMLPARLEVLKKLEEDKLYAPIVKALLNGRSFRKLKLWGLIEDRLSQAIGQVWQALYTKEHPNIEQEISNVFEPLERRLQLTLSDS